MPKLTLEEMSNIIHELKNERVVICGAMMRFKALDKRISGVINSLYKIVEGNNDE